MSYGFDIAPGATEIGLTSLGCIGTDGSARCPRYNKSCTVACSIKCMTTAMTDFPEAKPEILLAGLTVASMHATTLSQVHKALDRFQKVIQLTAIS